ncbi:hypothetical protein [Alienimonas californiensis]|uniref:Uncharacterized protein n=1 Tax=Alienimonas californiensis TaxID=2527989 RepID=A0A517PFQ3_9PLAN|nr:hypothetical protein [Alienimonas californiensis]QDT18188.1 hypothetical protein CA12_43290 [Alienimonas californiensis]
MLTRRPQPLPAAPAPGAAPPSGVRVVALTRGEERFVYLFRADRVADCLARLAVHAADPSLSLTAADAALLAERIREG